VHRVVGQRWLDRVGLVEADLSCGGHLSLSSRYAKEMTRSDVTPTPLWSNCSGKHAGLLALARLHGWPTAGYEQLGHPVQDEVVASLARWSGVPAGDLKWGVDGCTAAAVAMPLHGMATAWARLGTSDDLAFATIRAAMIAHPEMVAGSDRLDTVLMRAWPGRVLAKVGAEGVYGAALPMLGLGIGLKVEDGDFKSAGYALTAVLSTVLAQHGITDEPTEPLAPWNAPVIRNTRGEPVGAIAVRGALTFTTRSGSSS
jgi:L-asparaginase II